MNETGIRWMMEGDIAEELIEQGHRLFSGTCSFLISVASPEQLPIKQYTEIAFAGRSNVGKSSLINTLTNRKTLAKTSNTPGRTRELNFFSLSNKAYIVDMPGYGYAKAPKSKIEAWNDLIRLYLAGRTQLKRVFLLLDARHGIKKTDCEVMDLLDRTAVVYQAVMTKVDKLSQTELENTKKVVGDILRKRPAAHPDLLITSSCTGIGIIQLRTTIFELIEQC